MNRQQLSELLALSLDHPLTEEQQRVLQEALRESAELRTEKEELLQMRQLLRQPLTDSSGDFINRVLQKSKQLPAETGITRTLIRLLPRVAAACFVLVLVSLFSIYLAEGNLSGDAIVGTFDVSPEEAYTLLVEE